MQFVFILCTHVDYFAVGKNKMHEFLKSILGPIVFGAQYTFGVQDPGSHRQMSTRMKVSNSKGGSASQPEKSRKDGCWHIPAGSVPQTKDKKDLYHVIPEMKASI